MHACLSRYDAVHMGRTNKIVLPNTNWVCETIHARAVNNRARGLAHVPAQAPQAARAGECRDTPEEAQPPRGRGRRSQRAGHRAQAQVVASCCSASISARVAIGRPSGGGGCCRARRRSRARCSWNSIMLVMLRIAPSRLVGPKEMIERAPRISAERRRIQFEREQTVRHEKHPSMVLPPAVSTPLLRLAHSLHGMARATL
jgi:hypothetical protein